MFEITLKFLAAVEKNNTTEWLHTNYDLYQQERKRFQRFLEPLLQSAKALFPFRSELKVSQTMFRFNKDLRYSREKTPYKNHFWAEFSYEKRRSGYPCFYFHLANKNSFIGVWAFRAGPILEPKMRKYAILNFEERKKIQTSKPFQEYFWKLEMRAEEWEYEVLYYKSLYTVKKLFANDEKSIKKLTPEWQKILKMTYKEGNEFIESMPKNQKHFFYQLCFMKNRIRDRKLSDELVISWDILWEAKKGLEIAAPLINFLQKACE